MRVARTIIEQSREVWLAADSSKFKRQAMVELAHISQIDRFFTDAHPQEPLAQVLLDSGVRCEVAAAPNGAGVEIPTNTSASNL
ncbi:Glycerol-3-phosphate regulon repressor [compost metagenome]